MPNYDGNPADCVGDVPEGSAIDTSTPGNVHVQRVGRHRIDERHVQRRRRARPRSPTPGPTRPASRAAPPSRSTARARPTPTRRSPTLTWSQTSRARGDAVERARREADLHHAGRRQPERRHPHVPTVGERWSDVAVDGLGEHHSVASTPTVVVSQEPTRGGTCSNFCTGDASAHGTTITNPDGTNPPDYSYAWTQTGGRTTSLSSTTAANPSSSCRRTAAPAPAPARAAPVR